MNLVSLMPMRQRAAFQSPRGDIQYETYYDAVSDGDIIIDLIEEVNQQQYTKQYIDRISNFSVPDINTSGIVVGTSDIPNEMEQSDIVDVHVVDSSNQVV